MIDILVDVLLDIITDKASDLFHQLSMLSKIKEDLTISNLFPFSKNLGGITTSHSGFKILDFETYSDQVS